MPILGNEELEANVIPGSNYGFSGTRIDTLGATEFTLVAVAADTSGSVYSFSDGIENCIREIVVACQRSPRCDNLMLRMTQFNSSLDEMHGFKPLQECNTDDYKDSIQCGGSTALYDAADNAVRSVSSYGRQLMSNDYDVNGIVVVITDGCDNASAMTTASVKKALTEAVQGENLESIVSILVGVNINDSYVSGNLADFSAKAGFTQYVELGDANEKTLAKLADFVSRSISAQSQALGTGGPSQSLTF